MRKALGFIIVVAACTVVLTGCHVKVTTGGEGKSVGVSIDTNGIHVGAGGTEVSLDSPLIKIETDTASGKKEISSDEISVPSIPAGSIRKLECEVEMGNIEVKTHKEDTIDISYEYKVSGKDEDKCREIADLLELNVDTAGSECAVKPMIKSSTNIGRYLEKNYGVSYSVTVDVKLVLPETVEKLDVNTAMGDIAISDVNGKFNVDTAMGAITANNVAFTEDSEIKSAMGNISVSIASVPAEAELEVKTAMGNVSVGTASGMKIETKSFKDDGLDGEFKTVIEGKLTVEGSTDLGRVSVQ